MRARGGPSLIVLVALAVVLWGGQYVRRGLWEPDEARYAYVAREMREDDRWFVPHVHGEPYPDKPPLMFWLINAGAVVTGGGINGVSARWPSLLGAVLTLWATAQLALRWSGGRAAWRAVLVLLTSWLFWYEGGWGRMDALLCGLVMMSVYGFTVAAERASRAGLVCAYLFAGLAMLAKGPIGLVVPMGIHAAVTAVDGTGPRPAWRQAHWLWGPLLAALLPGAWLMIAWMQHAPPEYFAAMFGPKSFGRVLQALDHGRPFYYYLAHFPLELMPWTLWLPAVWIGLGRGALRLRLGAWLGFVLLLFSCFATKRSPYVLAAYPAAALLVATGWDRLITLSARWRNGLAETAIGLVAVAGLVEAVASFLSQWPVARWPLWTAAVVLLVGAWLLLIVHQRDGLGQQWFATYAGVWFVHHLILGVLVSPAFNELKAPVALAAEARENLPAGQPIHLFRQQLAIVPLYAERPGRHLRTVSDIDDAMSRHDRGIIVFALADWEPLRPRLEQRLRVRDFSIGAKRLVWAEFGPPVPAGD